MLNVWLPFYFTFWYKQRACTALRCCRQNEVSIINSPIGLSKISRPVILHCLLPSPDHSWFWDQHFPQLQKSHQLSLCIQWLSLHWCERHQPGEHCQGGGEHCRQEGGGHGLHAALAVQVQGCQGEPGHAVAWRLWDWDIYITGITI